MREPIPEIYAAAEQMSDAVNFHLAGNHIAAEAALLATNCTIIRQWTESLWGSKAANPDQSTYHRFRSVPGLPPFIPRHQRVPKRMPSAVEEREIIEHYGRHCVFCGIPLIHARIRTMLKALYPAAVPWGSTNETQHVALQCMWVQFDHVLPHCRGGDNSLSNVVVTCAPCNYGRGDRTLDELGLIDPRPRARCKSSWDGLERLIA